MKNSTAVQQSTSVPQTTSPSEHSAVQPAFTRRSVDNTTPRRTDALYRDFTPGTMELIADIEEDILGMQAFVAALRNTLSTLAEYNAGAEILAVGIAGTVDTAETADISAIVTDAATADVPV